MADEGSGNIKVVVRCRPLNSRELARGATELIRMEGNQTLLDPPPESVADAAKGRGIEKKTHAFTFDKSYWSAGDRNEPRYCSQQTLYNDLGEELLDHSFAGFNACIVAYGQTGSGKSYSMMGYGADKGIIPLTCMELFGRTESKTAQDSNLRFTVEVSYIEIYNEKVKDLLNPRNKGNLKVREHPSLGPYVEDLSKVIVGNYDEMMNLMDEGNKARTVAATNMNETSSRSHAVFTLLLTQKRHDPETDLDTEKVSRINLVDLAGSERANSTGATGQRLKEGANINKSLTTLGKVISALALASDAKPKGKKGKADDFIPYRDSVLTWLLKDSLGGNSKTAMIAAISPADYDETLSTLRYADQAKKIKNKAVVNEDPNAKLVRELKEELELLRARVAGAGGGGGAHQEATYDPSVPPEKQIVTYRTKEGEIKRVTKAELQEQLHASEKLMRDLNETWEEKLARTHEVQKEREAALEELGITMEKNTVGVHTPKKIPHLVNLNEDPLMSECLIYQLKPGKSMVGRNDSGIASIRLSGETILEEHCYFENSDGKVVLYAMPGSTTFLNGKQLQPDTPHKLRSGFRIILGEHHVFRFNNPEEVRKRRDRHRSNLHLSVTAADIDGQSSTSPRPDSPTSSASEADVDWNFARREAALARNGMDPTLESLPDEEINKLYDRITKVKTQRSHKSRPESSLSHTEDVWSDFGRPFGPDAFTDDTSLDPGQGSPELNESVREMQGLLEQQRIEFESRLSTISESSENEDLKLEKEYMEAQLRAVQSQMKRLIEIHARGTRDELEAAEPVLYSAHQLRLIRRVLNKWRSHRAFSMAETILSSASLLKEANVASKEQHRDVSFNFTIASGGTLANPVSHYDTLGGLEDLGDVADPILLSTTQPTVAIQVLDKHHGSAYSWSIEKLQQNIQRIRSLSSYLDRPSYSRHLQSSECFYNSPAPEYSFIGNALISLSTIFRQLSSTSTVPIFCRYTAEAIGSCRADIKIVNMTPPGRGTGGSASSTRSSSPLPNAVPSGSKLGFFLTVDSVKGLSSHEFSSLHLQVRLSSFLGTSVSSDEVYSSTAVDIDQGSLTELKFRRSFSIAATSRVLAHLRTGYAPIEFFARVKPCYLEKLERWNEMRELQGTHVKRPRPVEDLQNDAPPGSNLMRRPETDFVVEQTHAVVARLQISELGADGHYAPVSVISAGQLDPGCFQLRQGIQRRVSLSLSCSSGRQLPFTGLCRLCMGNIRLLDGKGRIHESPSTQLVDLPLPKEQLTNFGTDGMGSMAVEVLWDSGSHNTDLLNRVTTAKHRVLLQLQWYLVVENCLEPIRFSMDVAIAIRSRDAGTPSKILTLLASSTITNRSWSVFKIRLSPPLTRSPRDLWRLDTSEKYVRGEEKLASWAPRGISCVEDYERLITTEQRAADVQAIRAVLTTLPRAPISTSDNNPWKEEKAEELLRKCLEIWMRPTPRMAILNVSPPNSDTRPKAKRPQVPSSEPLLMVGASHLVGRSEVSMKKGHLMLLVDAHTNTWQKRWFVLRRPYLHMYSQANEVEDLDIISLEGSKIEFDATTDALFGRPYVFTVFTPANSYALAAPSSKELQLWVSKLDPAR